MGALGKLTLPEEPVVAKCRVQSALSVFYLMRDVVCQGFGSGVWDRKGVWYNVANWADHHKGESSDQKEENNLTFKVEKMAEAGTLNEAELMISEMFIFMDTLSI